MLTLTSCEPHHEPGFSRSECLELARRIEREGPDLMIGWFPPCDDPIGVLSGADRDMVIAALRAYAR